MNILEKLNWCVAICILLFIAIAPEVIHVYSLDKVQHITLSSALLLIFVLLASIPIAISIFIIMIIGISKEIGDYFQITGHSGIFSVGDIAADAAGVFLAIIAIILITHKDNYKKV